MGIWSLLALGALLCFRSNQGSAGPPRAHRKAACHTIELCRRELVSGIHRLCDSSPHAEHELDDLALVSSWDWHQQFNNTAYLGTIGRITL